MNRPKPLQARVADFDAYAERFILSIKSECLYTMILFGERSLRRQVSVWMNILTHEVASI